MSGETPFEATVQLWIKHWQEFKQRSLDVFEVYQKEYFPEEYQRYGRADFASLDNFWPEQVSITYGGDCYEHFPIFLLSRSDEEIREYVRSQKEREKAERLRYLEEHAQAQHKADLAQYAHLRKKLGYDLT